MPDSARNAVNVNETILAKTGGQRETQTPCKTEGAREYERLNPRKNWRSAKILTPCKNEGMRKFSPCKKPHAPRNVSPQLSKPQLVTIAAKIYKTSKETRFKILTNYYVNYIAFPETVTIAAQNSQDTFMKLKCFSSN